MEVHYRIGSLEILRSTSFALRGVHYRIGSLETTKGGVKLV